MLSKHVRIYHGRKELVMKKCVLESDYKKWLVINSLFFTKMWMSNTKFG